MLKKNPVSDVLSVNYQEALVRKLLLSVAYSKSCQTSKMEHFAKIVNGQKSLTIFAKGFILDV